MPGSSDRPLFTRLINIPRVSASCPRARLERLAIRTEVWPYLGQFGHSGLFLARTDWP